MKSALLHAAHVFCRLHRWTAAILVLSWASPFSELPESARSRFLYASIMARNSRRARGLLARILRRERDRSSDCNAWLALAAWRFGELKLASTLARRAERLGAGTEEPRLAHYVYTLAELHLTDRFREELRVLLEPLLAQMKAQKPVLVVQVSRKYLDFFHLWAGQVAKHAPGASLLVVALDRDAATAISRDYDLLMLDMSRYFLVDSSGRLLGYSKSQLWISRIFLLRELVARGRRVVMLDLDAMLVGDLEAMLSELPEADVVAQIEPYSIPADAARKLGFILCCGFMVFKPTAATRSFLDRYTKAVLIEMDDQLALNHILAQEGNPRLRRTSRWTEFESAGIHWCCPSAELVSRSEFHGSVVRHFHQTGQTIETLKSRLGIQDSGPLPSCRNSGGSDLARIEAANF